MTAIGGAQKLGNSETRKVLLTFDVEGTPPKEDYFNSASATCLHLILNLLDEQGFKGIFFIPASVAEQISRHPTLMEQLRRHVIGYHSSAHSINPKTFQCVDVAGYKQAFEIAVQRETSHINLENGQIDGEGGLLALKKVFPNNAIVCFRAPFLVWSPPHLEALRTLGIKFDFSTHIAMSPRTFRGITFYPDPVAVDEMLATFVNRKDRTSFPKPIESLLLRRKVTVLLMHPSSLIQDSYTSSESGERGATRSAKTKLALCTLRLLFSRIKILQRSNLIEVTASMTQNWPDLHPETVDVDRIYLSSVKNAVKLFNYHPRFMLAHFRHFFSQRET